jgi:cell division protein FtsA
LRLPVDTHVRRDERMVCGLDVGTRKTCAVAVRLYPDGTPEVAGSGHADSCGLVKSVIVNLDEAGASIRRAVEDLEAKSGICLDWVMAGISGAHIGSHHCRAAASVEGKYREVTARDMAQVILASQSISLPPGREILHMLPQEFLLDERNGIRDPVGLAGSQLAVRVHAISADSALTQNLIHAANLARTRVRKVAFQPLASGEAVLTADEKEAGAALIDIGGGTTGIALFVGDSVPFASVIPVGGGHFSSDLADGVGAPTHEAERIKREYGNVLLERVPCDEAIRVKGFGNRDRREVSRREACEILRYRALELLQLVKDELVRSGLGERLVAGAVFTGGGSMLEGILELAGEILQMPARLGLPLEFDGMTAELAHPAYAGAIGLAMLQAREISAKNRQRAWPPAASSLTQRFLSWIGN